MVFYISGGYNKKHGCIFLQDEDLITALSRECSNRKQPQMISLSQDSSLVLEVNCSIVPSLSLVQ